MTSKLALYNRALRRLGERRLSSLTEDRKPRHELDEVYADGFVNGLLEKGNWNFALRAVEQTYDSDITPDFGFLRVFTKPADWVRTSAFCLDEYFKVPISAYADEAGFWSCDYDTIYVKYVSSDSDYGSDLGAWPDTFAEWAATKLALLAAPSISRGKSGVADLEKAERRLLVDAKTKDAANEGAKFPPLGSWARARFGGSRDREDR
jgi:hypothetical protein